MSAILGMSIEEKLKSQREKVETRQKKLRIWPPRLEKCVNNSLENVLLIHLVFVFFLSLDGCQERWGTNRVP